MLIEHRITMHLIINTFQCFFVQIQILKSFPKSSQFQAFTVLFEAQFLLDFTKLFAEKKITLLFGNTFIDFLADLFLEQAQIIFFS